MMWKPNECWNFKMKKELIPVNEPTHSRPSGSHFPLLKWEPLSISINLKTSPVDGVYLANELPKFIRNAFSLVPVMAGMAIVVGLALLGCVTIANRSHLPLSGSIWWIRLEKQSTYDSFCRESSQCGLSPQSTGSSDTVCMWNEDMTWRSNKTLITRDQTFCEKKNSFSIDFLESIASYL